MPDNVSASSPKIPRTWITYIFCAALAGTTALDVAGLPSGTALGLVFLPGMLVLAVFVVVHVIRVPWLFGRHRLFGLIPLLACLASPLVGSEAGHALFNGRFAWRRAQYELVAEAVRSGTYELPLHGKDQALGFWASARHADRKMDADSKDLTPNSPVIAVDFLAVTHGFAGHEGYLRVYDDLVYGRLQSTCGKPGLRPTLPGTWRYCRPLQDRWFIVGD